MLRRDQTRPGQTRRMFVMAAHRMTAELARVARPVLAGYAFNLDRGKKKRYRYSGGSANHSGYLDIVVVVSSL